MRGQSTTRNISNALKLAQQCDACGAGATNIAYDRKTASWTAWMCDYESLDQIGLSGQGKDPMAAVEAMIENNRNNEE